MSSEASRASSVISATLPELGSIATVSTAPLTLRSVELRSRNGKPFWVFRFVWIDLVWFGSYWRC